MRYVIVDLDGAARDHLSNRTDVREALREAEDDTAGIAAELYVMTYDAYGDRVGSPERGDELLAGATTVVRAVMDWSDSADGAEDVTKVVAGASR